MSSRTSGVAVTRADGTAAPLDPDAEYLVYCRSGNRSGQAIALMEQAGFSNLTNLGSLEQAASTTGIQIVP